MLMGFSKLHSFKSGKLFILETKEIGLPVRYTDFNTGRDYSPHSVVRMLKKCGYDAHVDKDGYIWVCGNYNIIDRRRRRRRRR